MCALHASIRAWLATRWTDAKFISAYVGSNLDNDWKQLVQIYSSRIKHEGQAGFRVNGSSADNILLSSIHAG